MALLDGARWAILRTAVVVGTVMTAGFTDPPRAVRLAAYDDLSFLNVAIPVCTAVSVALVVAGLVRLRRDRLGAYRLFERALLVSILLTHVFVFVKSQFGAVFGLGLDIVLLLGREGMIDAEEGRPDEAPSLIEGPDRGVPA